MPTYVYACADCSAQFEQFQRFSDEPLTICPRCQGSIRRVFQPVGIVFKGSGWYINDSRSTGSKSSKSNTDAASTSSTESSQESSSEVQSASDTAETPKKEPAPKQDSAESSAAAPS